METKKCSKCSEEKLLSFFYKDNSKSKGYRPECISCGKKLVEDSIKKDKCGIYKITSPIGRVYIGESKNINKRWRNYNNLSNCKNQTILLSSFNKYNVKNHKFEIIEECEINELLCRERYWQDFYDVLNGGLNCSLTNCGDKKYVHSEETKKKISLTNTGKEGLKGNKNGMFGKTHSEDVKKQMSINRKGKNHWSFGKGFSEKHKQSISIKRKSLDLSRGKNPKAKIVLCNQTGIFYECIEDAADAYNMNKSTLRNMLNGNSYNKTSLIFINENKKIPKEKYELRKIINIISGEIHNSVEEASLHYNININTLRSYLNGSRKNKTNLKYYESNT